MAVKQVFTPEIKDEIIRKYHAGVPAERLSETYKCGVSTVYAWAKEFQLRNKLDQVPAEILEENRKLKELLLFLLKEHVIK